MATAASRSPAAAGGDAPANNDSSANSVARHYLDCASRILRETMRAHVWLDYEHTTMILFNGMVFFCHAVAFVTRVHMASIWRSFRAALCGEPLGSADCEKDFHHLGCN